MKNKEINRRLQRAIKEAPINLLDEIKNQSIQKMKNHSHITRQVEKQKKSFKPLYALATLSLVLIFVFSSFYQSMAIASQVYLDINPGIEISLNKSDKVLNIEATKLEESIIKALDYKGKDLYQLMEDLLNELKDHGYMDKDKNAVLLSVKNASIDKKREQMTLLNDLIHEYFTSNNISLLLLRQEISEDNEVAGEKSDVSVGKKTFIKNLVKLDYKLDVDDLMDLSLEDLINLSEDISLDLKSIIESDEEVYDYYKRPFMISVDEAKKIALKLTKGGVVVEIELDKDDDKIIYEIEILNGNIEFEISIDAYSGEVLEFEKDYKDDKDKGEDDKSKGERDRNNKGDILDKKAISEITLDYTRGGVIIKIELEEDDDEYIYEVEVLTETGEYSLEINAYSGKIEKIDYDENNESNITNKELLEGIISIEQAKNIALSLTDGGTITEIKLDEDDGLFLYEIEVESGDEEYEIKLDAQSGQVISFEKD